VTETSGAGAARPVLLTVDDDPSVSRAVARDLRRKHGETFRVVRADSGPDALEALKELRRRGDEVAVLLAGYRMPQRNGVEFLERAMDVYPHARRALLTAYATPTPRSRRSTSSTSTTTCSSRGRPRRRSSTPSSTP
jgi:thioredoxin reductase (NADPH)